MKKIIFIFLLLAVFSLNAQLKGNVKDKNGVPLPFVSIYFNKTITGTTTNDNGDYILNLDKKKY